MKKNTQKVIAFLLLILVTFWGILLHKQRNDFVWYWFFGISFGVILQRSRLCFVSSTSEPFITGSTEQFRAILIGILAASLGITAIKYLSDGSLDMLGVSAISIPFILGAFIFGIGMVLCGCCSVGVFIRLAEGYIVHIVTLVSIIAGYLFANSHYQIVWSSFVVNAPSIFLPAEIGWTVGVFCHIIVIILLYLVAVRFEDNISSSNSSKILKGGIMLGLFVVLHYLILKSSWSVTGAFFWIGKLFQTTDINTLQMSLGPNIRNIGLFIGALISILANGNFKIKKIRSGKQICTNILGGTLMGYGACLASGCNISSFFIAAASLSLSAWVFMIFLFAGVFIGIKLLYKLL